MKCFPADIVRPQLILACGYGAYYFAHTARRQALIHLRRAFATMTKMGRNGIFPRWHTAWVIVLCADNACRGRRRALMLTAPEWTQRSCDGICCVGTRSGM